MRCVRALLHDRAGLACLLFLGAVLLAALLAPWLAPWDPLAVDGSRKLAPCGPEHWLGTDRLGRDIFSRLLYGARATLGVSLLAMMATVSLGALLGMVVALMRMSRLKILRTVFNVYVEILRGTPILLQLYFFWIGLPKLVPFELTDTQCIVAALVVNASAFISEIIRAGIGAVDKGQWEAARSIGLSETHVMTRIILPQAVKNILPALCNEFISTVKGTSLASVFFVGELMTSFKTVQSATFLALQSLTIVGIIYFLLNFILSRLLRVIERRLTVSD